MKKTNVILGIVIGIFAICAITILIVAMVNSMKDDTVPVNIDFAALSSNIEEATSLDTAKMQEVTLDDLQQDFNINAEWVKQVIGERPYLNVNASMYVIVEATEGNVTNVTKAFEKYGETYENMWKDYLADEYELVQTRQIGSKGNYVYFIVGDFAKDIVELIK